MSSANPSSQTIESAEGHVDPAAAFVPVQTRSERFRSYAPDAFEMPSGREVNWKHTPVAKLAPLFADEPSSGSVDVAIDAGDAAVDVVESTAGGAAVRGEFFTPEDRASAITWKNAEDALHLRIPAGSESETPIRVSLTGAGTAAPAHAHIILEAMPNSRATVILAHTGSATYGQNVEIIVREGAALTVISLQDWDDDTIHLAAHQARVDRDASLRHFVVTFGGSIVRVNPNLELTGTGSEGEMYGLVFADAGQHFESQVFLFHKGAHTRGDVLYKGALQGESARTVWIGDVLIGREATGTNTYEANRNLLLTEGTRADSIPNLEIETGDIGGAGHASATGRFDDEQLFYLQARGIPDEAARRLVVFGFLSEVVQKIDDEELRERLTQKIEAELALGEGPER